MSLVTLPVSFTAIGCPALGAPLEAVTRTVLSVQPDEVLVRVSHASTNPMDPKMQQTNMFQLPLPMVLGYNFSGVVVALGTGDAFPGEIEALTLGVVVMGSTFDCYAIACIGAYR